MLENLWLVHPEDAMCDAFRERFVGLPGVRVIRGRFEAWNLMIASSQLATLSV